MTRRFLTAAVALTLLLGACGGGTASVTDVAPLESIDAAAVEQLLTVSEQPVVLNVWASWCGPCRSEAPLLREANAQFADSVRFIGIDVRDRQEDAQAFISEFGLDGFTHLFDQSGSVPAALGGFGVPITFFFAPGGELSHMHSGVIDERTLALQIDELLQP